jgi:VIT1/CCC1 family predicted Fe2+/Mn2+ transporter
MPLITALVTPQPVLIPVVIITSLLFLALLSGVGAHAGGALVMKAAIRVTSWEALALTLAHCLE